MSLSRCTSLALALFLLSNAPAHADGQARDTQVKILYLSDPHVCEGSSSNRWTATIDGGVNTNKDQWAFLIDWACDRGADAIVVTGDLTVAPNPPFTGGCTARFKSEFEAMIAGRAVLLPVAGNHDTEEPWGDNGVGPGELNNNPYFALTDSFPNLFRGRSYYAYDIGPVRFLSLNNIADTTWSSGGGSPTYTQEYPNCNPPFKGSAYWGANGFPSGNPDGTNPDFGGITDENSTQRQWLAGQLTGTWPIWRVVGMHRGVWTPYSSTTSRPSLKSARYDLWADLTAAGVDQAFQGDQHIIAMSKRIASYPASATVVNKSDSTGVVSVALHGHYTRRSVDTAVMPSGSLIFSKGGVDSVATKWVYGMFCTYTGNRCEERLVRTAQGASPGYALRVVTVASRAILAEGRRDF